MFDLTFALTPVALVEGTSRCSADARVAEAKDSSGSMAARQLDHFGLPGTVIEAGV